MDKQKCHPDGCSKCKYYREELHGYECSLLLRPSGGWSTTPEDLLDCKCIATIKEDCNEAQ